MIEPGQDKGKSYIEHTAEKAGTSYKAKLKTAIDRLIPQVSDFEELLTKSYSPRSSFPFMEDVSGESSPFATKDSLFSQSAVSCGLAKQDVSLLPAGERSLVTLVCCNLPVCFGCFPCV